MKDFLSKITLGAAFKKAKKYCDEHGGGYVLPVAAPDTLGGVQPVAKDSDMTQEVGVDEDGKLFTAPAAANVIVQPDSMTQAGGYDVPDLTVEQVTALYNGLVAGKTCVVTDDQGDLQFKLSMGDASTGCPSILLQYYWLAWIDYQVTEQDIVAITAHSVPELPAHQITSVTVGTDTIDIVIS